MPEDKYSAVWVSHSSMGDFLRCPRLYFFRNVYKDPKTGKKINLVNPSLSLGQAVHGALEGLARHKAEERFSRPLLGALEEEWLKISGKRGGFQSGEEEEEVKKRGREMILRVERHPGPLARKTVKMPPTHNNMPPNFFLSAEENIILCGKIDWLEYMPEDDSVRVIDFKTGKYDEKEDSLQLPIYRLLLDALQKRKVSGAAYWYLDRDDEPTAVVLPAAHEATQKVMAAALAVKKAREGKEFSCPRGRGGCFACRPFEKILSGEAESVGLSDDGRQELFIET
jgi:ATP-dependent helicase/DNAse subunit B